MEVLPAVLVLLMLATAVPPDLRERRVGNGHWTPYVAAAAILLAADIAAGAAWTPWLIAVVASATIYGLWWLRLFGGADGKALLVIAWLWPGTPQLADASVVPVLDVLVNAALVTMALPFVLLAVNAARGHVALPAMLLGVRMPLAAAQRRNVWPMQEVHDGRLRWRFRARVAATTDWSGLRQRGLADVWVTPKVPFMVSLAVGAAAAALWGNLMLRLLLQAVP